MKIGILGSGDVGKMLAQGFLKHGYTVMRGSRDPGKLTEWKNLAGTAAESVVKSCAAFLKGKTVFDTTNPIADLPPIDGVLKYFAQRLASRI